MGSARSARGGNAGRAWPSSRSLRTATPSPRRTGGGSLTNPCCSKRLRATLAEATHNWPLPLRQLTARQKSRTRWRRTGVGSLSERALKRASTCWLTHRPQMRTASNTL